jgi:hypothetical protein
MAEETASCWQDGPPCAQQPGLRSGSGRQARACPGRAHCGASSSSKGNSSAAAATAAPAADAAAAAPPPCSTALADEPLLSSLRKLSPCRFRTMFGPDAMVPLNA